MILRILNNFKILNSKNKFAKIKRTKSQEIGTIEINGENIVFTKSNILLKKINEKIKKLNDKETFYIIELDNIYISIQPFSEINLLVKKENEIIKKKLEDLKNGDCILTFDKEKNNLLKERKIKNIFKFPIKEFNFLNIPQSNYIIKSSSNLVINEFIFIE